jgi:SAM-dependent methyltransferase
MMHPPVDFTRFYTDAYSLSDAAQAEHYGRWRELGARSKADHVVELARRAGVRPRTLVEIGCGAGDLLAQLFARGIAERQDGFELSAPAAEIARSHGIPQTRIEVFDGARVPASDGAYDLAVVSHVLEHVPDPASLLAEAVRVARWVLVEVPLEANRSAARPAKRAAAATIGHIQFFDRAAVRALCAGAGLEIRAELGDPLSYSHHAFHARGTRGRARAAAKAVARRLAWRAAPRIAERSFTVHYACIATADGAA